MAQQPTLVTERLLLEPLREEHAADMVAVLAAPELYEFTGGEPPDVEGLTRRYRAQAAGSPDPAEQWLNWIIRIRTDDVVAGYVQATVVGDAASVAWLIGVERQGHGLASEAARAMVDDLVASGIRRIDAHIHPAHAASQRVAASLGLTNTGVVDDDGEEVWATTRHA